MSVEQTGGAGGKPGQDENPKEKQQQQPQPRLAVPSGSSPSSESSESSSSSAEVAALHARIAALEADVRSAERSSEQLSLLIDSIKDYALMNLSLSGYVTSWNAGAQRLLGYAAEEIIGQHFSRFYRAEDLALHKPENE